MSIQNWFRRERRRQPNDELQILARNLPQRSRLRPIWETYVSGKPVSATTLMDALKWTDTSEWREHAIACRLLALLDLSAAERKAAASLLRRPLLRPTDFSRSGRDYLLTIGCTFLFWSVFIATLLLRMWEDWPTSLFWAAPVACVAALVPTLVTMPAAVWYASFLQKRRAGCVQRAAATAMIPLGDAQCVAVLSHYVQRTSPIHQEAIAALLAILPTVTANDADVPGSALVELAAHPQEALALAALDALELVGPGTAAHAVQRLATRARSAQVRERAAAILPALIGRATRARDASTLLRPSADDNVHNLLQPVYERDPDVRNLLRASQDSDQASEAQESSIQPMQPIHPTRSVRSIRWIGRVNGR